MKILILSKYPMRGPSSRYRFYQFLPHLQAAGHQFSVLPLFTDAYLDHLFAGRSPGLTYVAARFLSRLKNLLLGRSYDLAWIEGELFPFVPGFLERFLHPLLPARRVYEFDDANWLRYTGKPLLENKMLAILKSAAGVVVGNDYLEAYVRQVNANTLVIPTVVDWEKYRDASPAHRGQVIGWVGSNSTRFFLEALAPVLQTLADEIPFTLEVVGAEVAIEGVEVRLVPWSEDDEVARIQGFDVGIMPLSDTPWSRGKCGLKMVQYLAAGVPAVVSPVGVNTTYITASRGGYLAEDSDAWVAALRKLLENRMLREEMGRNGREWVRATMTVQSRADQLIAFLNGEDPASRLPVSAGTTPTGSSP